MRLAYLCIDVIQGLYNTKLPLRVDHTHRNKKKYAVLENLGWQWEFA